MFRGKFSWLPEYVMFVNDDGTRDVVHFNALTRHQKREVCRHGKVFHVTDNKPNYLEMIRGSTAYMKYGGGYTGDDYKYMVERFKVSGHIIVPNVRDVHGGGRGSRSWGVIHAAMIDIMKDIYNKHDILNEMNALPIEKRLNRSHKFMGEMEKVNDASVKIVPGLDFMEGLIMTKLDLPFLTKFTGPLKGLAVPFFPNLACDDNVLVSADENKLNLTEEKLSKNIYINRKLCADTTFSRNIVNHRTGHIGRLARNAFDLQSLLGMTPNPDLGKYKAFYENGTFDADLIKELFGFIQNGNERIRPVGEKIIAGMNIHDLEIKEEVMKVLWRTIKRRLQGKIPASIYGYIIPLEYVKIMEPMTRIKKAYFTRWPWIYPILTEYAIFNHAIAVPHAVIKLFGGDCDGDTGLIIHKKVINTGLDYVKSKSTLEDWMKAPLKVEAKPNVKSVHDTIAYILDQYSACGRVHNMCKIIVDIARLNNDPRVMELEARLTATKVQPFIDGFKYEGCDVIPKLIELAKEYNVDITNGENVIDAFNVFRSTSSSLENAIALANSTNPDPKSKSYYIRLLAKFKGWKLIRSDIEEAMLHLGEVIAS